MRVIVPGSFDPVTLGHLEVIKKAAQIYDEVFVVVFTNPEKTYTFSVEERVKMLILATDSLQNVIVSYSPGYVVDYMREHNIEKIIKGWRNDIDLQYEKRQADWNLSHGGYETELWECDADFKNISSTLVRNRIRENKSLDSLVPESVISYIKSIDKIHF